MVIVLTSCRRALDYPGFGRNFPWHGFVLACYIVVLRRRQLFASIVLVPALLGWVFLYRRLWARFRGGCRRLRRRGFYGFGFLLLLFHSLNPALLLPVFFQ